jgi:drug/metabolite transporter (DMT)-like permease
MKNRIKDIIALQLIIVIYTFSGVVAKYASSSELFSSEFVIAYIVEIAILGVYAILWQQIIKKFELSIAYANRSMALLWSMIWAVILFKEQVTVKNIIGVLIVILGTVIVNWDDNK